MKKTIGLLIIAVLLTVAFTSCEEDELEKKHVNKITLDGVETIVDSTMYWYAAAQGGDPYIRLLIDVEGQDNPDLLKLYVNKGLHDLPGTYTWMSSSMMGDSPDIDQYDMGYTANYAGMSYDWTTDGNTAGTNLVITELDNGEYKFEAEVTLNKGNWNWTTYQFEPEETIVLTLDYEGAITPL